MQLIINVDYHCFLKKKTGRENYFGNYFPITGTDS